MASPIFHELLISSFRGLYRCLLLLYQLELSFAQPLHISCDIKNSSAAQLLLLYIACLLVSLFVEFDEVPRDEQDEDI